MTVRNMVSINRNVVSGGGSVVIGKKVLAENTEHLPLLLYRKVILVFIIYCS